MAFEFSLKFGKSDKSVDKSIVYQRATQQADSDDYVYDQSQKLYFPTTDRNKLALKVLFNEVAEVNSVITYIAQLISRMKVVEYNGENPVLNSDIVAKLQQPNPLSTGENFTVENISSFFVFGNTAINSLTPFGFSKKYTDLFTLPYECIYPISEKAIDEYGQVGLGVDNRFNKLTHYNYFVDSYAKRIELNELIHWKDSNLNKDGIGWFEGESRLMSAILACENLKFLYETINTILGKRGVLGFYSRNTRAGEMINVLSPEQRKDAEVRLTQRYGVTKGKIPVTVVDTDLRYNKTDYGLSEFLPIEIKADIFKTICRVLGNVPDQIFSSDASATLDNLKISEKRIYTGVCIPIANSYYSTIGRYFGLDSYKKTLKVNTEDIESLQVDKKSEADTNKAWADYYSALLKDGIITKEYYAEQLGLPAPPKTETNGTNQGTTGSTGNNNESQTE